MQVNEIMIKGSVAVRSRATVAQAWQTLRGLGVRQVPVVDDFQRLVGLVSDHDLSPPPWDPTERDPRGEPAAPSLDAPVAALMGGAAHLFVDEDDDLDAVVDLMLENNLSVVPVVDPQVKVVGIVSYLDVLRILLARQGRPDIAIPPPPSLEQLQAASENI
jgi:acetoin utilization protein AcuB